MMFTNDPLHDFNMHEAEIEQLMERLPECSYCGEKVQDEFLYCINDEIICNQCLNDNFRKETEYYVK